MDEIQHLFDNCQIKEMIEDSDDDDSDLSVDTDMDDCDEIYSLCIKNILNNIILKGFYSNHYKIVDKSMELIRNKNIQKLIEYYGETEMWGEIYTRILSVETNFYLDITIDKCKDIKNDLKNKYEITSENADIFEMIEQQYSKSNNNNNNNNNIDIDVIKQERLKKWDIIRNIANENKQKLRIPSVNKTTSNDDHEFINNLAKDIDDDRQDQDKQIQILDMTKLKSQDIWDILDETI